MREVYNVWREGGWVYFADGLKINKYYNGISFL